jgi:hypothetical protein
MGGDIDDRVYNLQYIKAAYMRSIDYWMRNL